MHDLLSGNPSKLLKTVKPTIPLFEIRKTISIFTTGAAIF